MLATSSRSARVQWKRILGNSEKLLRVSSALILEQFFIEHRRWLFCQRSTKRKAGSTRALSLHKWMLINIDACHSLRLSEASLSSRASVHLIHPRRPNASPSKVSLCQQDEWKIENLPGTSPRLKCLSFEKMRKVDKFDYTRQLRNKNFNIPQMICSTSGNNNRRQTPQLSQIVFQRFSVSLARRIFASTFFFCKSWEKKMRTRGEKFFLRGKKLNLFVVIRGNIFSASSI